jgi:hypothetical protein
MKAELVYFLSKWAYKLLRPYIVRLVDDKLRPQWTAMILNELDELFDYNFKYGDGLYDSHDLQP